MTTTFAVQRRTAFGRTVYAVIDTRNGRTMARCDVVRVAMLTAALMNKHLDSIGDSGPCGPLLVTEVDMRATLPRDSWI